MFFTLFRVNVYVHHLDPGLRFNHGSALAALKVRLTSRLATKSALRSFSPGTNALTIQPAGPENRDPEVSETKTTRAEERPRLLLYLEISTGGEPGLEADTKCCLPNPNTRTDSDSDSDKKETTSASLHRAR